MWLDGDGSRAISSGLTDVALPVIVGDDKYVRLSCLADDAPDPLQDSSSCRFDHVGSSVAVGIFQQYDQVPICG